MTPNRFRPKCDTVAQQVVLKKMFERQLLVSRKAASLIGVTLHDIMAKNQACMTGKGIMDTHPGRPFYHSTSSFVKADINLSKQQKVGEGASAPQEIVHVKDERFSYPSGGKTTEIDSPSMLYTTRPLQIV